MNNRRGLTLLEVLVVISIISIMAAILFPVFARAKRAARAHHMKQAQKIEKRVARVLEYDGEIEAKGVVLDKENQPCVVIKLENGKYVSASTDKAKSDVILDGGTKVKVKVRRDGSKYEVLEIMKKTAYDF